MVDTDKKQPHKSVLVEEVLTYLNLKPGGVYVDVTFGAGGHTRAILEAEPTATVIAFDWDIKALEKFAVPLREEFGDRFRWAEGNFALLYKMFKKYKIGLVDGILADFGTSQVQIAQTAGLSVYRDAPLDMRMSRGIYKTTAATMVNTASEKELVHMFHVYGDERYARKIARAIVHDRETKPFKTVGQLASLIERLVPDKPGKKRKIHPATKVFQALRICVNKELDNINSFLPAALQMLKPGGRLVCISFHSLEDRMVKQFFRDAEKQNLVELLTKRVVMPAEEEVDRNRASRSSRLRAAQRLND